MNDYNLDYSENPGLKIEKTEYEKFIEKRERERKALIAKSREQQKGGTNINRVQIPLNSAKAWQNKAKALGRSPEHLKKVEQVISQAPRSQVGNKKMIGLNKTDFKAMQKDRQKFQQENSQSQPQFFSGKTTGLANNSPTNSLKK